MRRTPLVLVLPVLALALVSGSASAAPLFRPSLKTILQGGGGTIPTEWSGIWDNVDTVRTCGSTDIDNTANSRDTLCAGNYDPGQDGIEFECTGTASETAFDMTCTGTLTFGPCTVDFIVHVVGTRNGETSRTVQTIEQTPSPAFCGVPSCTEITSTSTRIAPQPASCATPTRKSTWGGLKMLYR